MPVDNQAILDILNPKGDVIDRAQYLPLALTQNKDGRQLGLGWPQSAIDLADSFNQFGSGKNPRPEDSRLIEAVLGLGAMGSAPKGALRSFAGRNSKSPKVQTALDLADKMYAAGKTPEEIKRATNVHYNINEKPLYEISDHNATLGQRSDRIFSGGERNIGNEMPDNRLGAVLNHPELYESYPFLKDVSTQVTRPLDSTIAREPNHQRGALSMHPRNNGEMEGFIQASGANSELGKSALLHEIDHLTSVIEGNPRGTSPKGFTPAAYQEYIRSAGETQADNVQKRMNMSPEERLNSLPQNTQRFPYSEQNIEHYKGVKFDPVNNMIIDLLSKGGT